MVAVIFMSRTANSWFNTMIEVNDRIIIDSKAYIIIRVSADQCSNRIEVRRGISLL